jgi:hypothetical protein
LSAVSIIAHPSQAESSGCTGRFSIEQILPSAIIGFRQPDFIGQLPNDLRDRRSVVARTTPIR